ncbi:MAG: HDOD domain-containing protein [Proteobacteria bacterium]|nr:HDOD domain-containing protein [Pseudomonadota bacterium]MBU1583576.1 HDOD domain-containing protein [Pseudomonadota bacterium]MBU2453258.1 HDOD domain-containing protein [Pseudomonadota bacterium]
MEMEDTLVGEKTIAFSIAQEILTTSVNIPTLPANGAKILAVARQSKDQIDIPSFAKLVESDPGLFTRILKMANSPFYGELDKIVSLRVAITRIGLVEIVDSVCLFFFQKLLPRFPDIEGFSYKDFWSHSWICAVANRRLGHPNLGMDVLPGELYMTGLLHGIGKLLLAIHFPDDFSKCVKQAMDLKHPLHKVEKDVFGTTDALVASRVLKAWNFPANICEGVAFHQMPELAPPEYIIIAGLTQFAYAMADVSGIGCSGDGLSMELSSTFLGQRPNLKISSKDVQEKLVQEILEAMGGKAGNIRSEPSKPPTPKPVTKSFENRHEKKGVFGWVKSLWS